MAVVPSGDSIEREEFEATRHTFAREIVRCEACGKISEFAGNPDECPIRRERYERVETVGARDGCRRGAAIVM